MAWKKPNHSTVLYIESRGSQGTTPLEVIRNTIAKILTELSVRGKLTGIKLMNNNGISAHKPITSASMVPLKWISASNYVDCLNDLADLTKEIRGQKPQIFKLIITTGSDEDISNTVKANAVDMAQEGIIVEVKRLQVRHSKRGILLPMIPCSIDGKYVQKEVQRCFTEAIVQSIENSSWSNPKKSGKLLKDLNILVDVGYPPMNFEKFKKGSKPNYNAQNKQIYSIEYNMEAEPLILLARPLFKILLHKTLGEKTSMLMVPNKNASTATMRRYRQILQTHLAMLECVSYIELIGIKNLDLELEVSFRNDDGMMETRMMSV